MTRFFRSAALLLGIGSSALLLSACEPPSSGSCDEEGGQSDGEVYRLRIYNCTEGEIIVKVNGRGVGTVPGFDQDSGDCLVTDLGTFPQCDEGVIEAIGYNSISNKIVWSADAVQASANECTVVGVLVPSEGVPDGVRIPSEQPTCKFLEIED